MKSKTFSSSTAKIQKQGFSLASGGHATPHHKAGARRWCGVPTVDWQSLQVLCQSVCGDQVLFAWADSLMRGKCCVLAPKGNWSLFREKVFYKWEPLTTIFSLPSFVEDSPCRPMSLNLPPLETETQAGNFSCSVTPSTMCLLYLSCLQLETRNKAEVFCQPANEER